MESSAVVKVSRVQGANISSRQETLAVEEPLEIRLQWGAAAARTIQSISITMRTPGEDFDLALGFLFSEGIVRGSEDLEDIEFCGPSGNVVKVSLSSTAPVDIQKLQRNFYTTSSCGVCGKSSLAALRAQSLFPLPKESAGWDARQIPQWPDQLRAGQKLFATTGGLHASGLFDRQGQLQVVREDVGRHNALDKVVGRALRHGLLPLHETALLVSGRASFELVQKAAMAGIPLLVAVGAPSSLAVDLARDVGMCIVGFVREGRFNIYTGEQRIVNHG